MAHRTKQGQEVHDRKVAEIARNLEPKGYRVRADLPGHTRPPAINGQIPDVVAQKGGKLLVREIETRATIKADRQQQETFREWAKAHGANYRTILAKKKR